MSTPPDTVSSSPLIRAPSDAAEALNLACFCFSLDQHALARALDSELGQPGLAEMVRSRCPFLFSAQPVFVAAPQLQRMVQVMQAVESVVALPAYREQVLAAAPAIARLNSAGPLGVFFGYGFSRGRQPTSEPRVAVLRRCTALPMQRVAPARLVPENALPKMPGMHPKCSLSKKTVVSTLSRMRCTWRWLAARQPPRRWPARPCVWPTGTYA